MEQILEHEDQVYFRAEGLIDLLIDRLEALGMEIDFYRDEWSEDELDVVRNQAKGFAKCLIIITNEYTGLTSDPERAKVYSDLATKMQKVVDA